MSQIFLVSLSDIYRSFSVFKAPLNHERTSKRQSNYRKLQTKGTVNHGREGRGPTTSGISIPRGIRTVNKGDSNLRKKVTSSKSAICSIISYILWYR